MFHKNIAIHMINVIDEQNNYAAEVGQLFDKLMAFQEKQEERMQQFMKEVIAMLKDQK